jgi:hypothetical protein
VFRRWGYRPGMTTTPFDPGDDPVAPDPLIPVPDELDDQEPDTAEPDTKELDLEADES